MGSFDVKIDEKGRFVIPVRWREAFAEGVAVTPSRDRCLQVWPQAAFEEFLTARREAGDGSLRYLLAETVSDTPDGAGRVALSRRLRDRAGLGREARLNGNLEHLELWDDPTWQAWAQAAEERLVTVGELAAGQPTPVPELMP